MDQTLITILIRDIAVPELLALLHKATPTEGEILITLSKDAANLKAAGQAFLDATRPHT